MKKGNSLIQHSTLIVCRFIKYDASAVLYWAKQYGKIHARGKQVLEYEKGNSLIQHETLIVYRLTNTISPMFFAEPNSIGHEPDMVYFPKGKSCRP